MTRRPGESFPGTKIHLTRYLSAQMGSPITLRPSPQMSAAIEDFGRSMTQTAYLTPVAYIETRERFGAIAVALPLSDDKAFFRLAIMVHKDGPVKII